MYISASPIAITVRYTGKSNRDSIAGFYLKWHRYPCAAKLTPFNLYSEWKGAPHDQYSRVTGTKYLREACRIHLRRNHVYHNDRGDPHANRPELFHLQGHL